MKDIFYKTLNRFYKSGGQIFEKRNAVVIKKKA